MGTDVRRQRAVAQYLGPERPGTAVEVVRRLLAVQAQDLRTARLALRARLPGLPAADIDRALSADRALVTGWLNRGTLHLVAREDYPWLWGLTAPIRAANSRRRLGEEGVPPADAERAVAIIERALTAEGPLLRAELAERVSAAGIRTAGQATPHLLGLAAMRGVALLGPLRAGRQAFVHPGQWLGAPLVPLTTAERARALADLARRYLRGHGPAAPADLVAWSGLSPRDVRAGLREIGAELVDAGGDLVDLADRPAGVPAVPPRLLPPFDPYLLGWADRGFAVPAEHRRRVHPGGGMLRAVVTVDGVAVGTWSATGTGGRVSVEVSPFEPGDAALASTVRAEIDDVARFLA